MYHFVARSHRGTLLFRDWEEAAWLWASMVRLLPGIHALVLMPDHVHLMHGSDVRPALRRAARSYARTRNCRRGQQGPVFAAVQPGERLVDAQKIRRSRRYLALNPPRAGLTRCPLAWPFSTYRDSLGMVLDPAVPPQTNPRRVHRYVASDPTTHVDGTPFPEESWHDTHSLGQVWDAVSAITRTPEPRLLLRGPARSLLIRSARVFTPRSAGDIARWAGITPQAIRRVPRAVGPDLRIVARALGDPRFAPLHTGDLRQLPGWGRYRRLS